MANSNPNPTEQVSTKDGYLTKIDQLSKRCIDFFWSAGALLNAIDGDNGLNKEDRKALREYALRVWGLTKNQTAPCTKVATIFAKKDLTGIVIPASTLFRLASTTAPAGVHKKILDFIAGCARDSRPRADDVEQIVRGTMNYPKDTVAAAWQRQKEAEKKEAEEKARELALELASNGQTEPAAAEPAAAPEPASNGEPAAEPNPYIEGYRSALALLFAVATGALPAHNIAPLTRGCPDVGTFLSKYHPIPGDFSLRANNMLSALNGESKATNGKVATVAA